MSNPEREIKDMDELIEKLSGVASDLEGVVMSDHTDAMNNVVNEWIDYTKKCIEELAESNDE